MRERPGRRMVTCALLLSAFVVLEQWYFTTALDAGGVDGVLRPVVASVLVGAVVVPFAAVLSTSYATRYSRARIAHPCLLATLCATSWLSATYVIITTIQPPPEFMRAPLHVVVVFGFFGLVVWLAVLVRALCSRRVIGRRLLHAADAAEAAKMRDHCRRALRSRWLRGDRRTAVELNLASALITLSGCGDQDDGLAEALAVIESSLSSEHGVWSFVAARRLVDAMIAKAQRSGELDGYEPALELLQHVAEHAKPVMADAPARALAARADVLMQLGERAARDDELARSEALHEQALVHARRAVELSPAYSSARALHTVALARIVGSHPVERDLDGAIDMCRSALRRLALGDASDRAAGYLALADLLILRAAIRRDAAAAAADRMRALFLCYCMCFSGELAHRARSRIPGLVQQLRRERGDASWSPGRGMGWMYRRLVAEQSDVPSDGAAELAQAWAAWAIADGSVHETAEAHWRWLRSIVAESRRRVLLDKERRLMRVQNLAAVTAGWLLEASRPREAAVALDIGRATLLSERMHREQDRLEQRLAAAGRLDLWTAWRAACDRISVVDRAVFGDPGGQVGEACLPPLDRTLATRFASDEYTALSDHERLLREIGAVPGCEDIGAPTSFDDLRAAACDGPLVYLAAVAERGFAIIVTGAAEPTVVELPAMMEQRVNEAARFFGHSFNPLDITAALVEREADDGSLALWRDIVEPLNHALAAGTLVTLIPVGAIGHLPLHLVGPVLHGPAWPGQAGFAVRYAPNARVLLRAQCLAREQRGANHSVVSVAIPETAGWAALPHAETESVGVVAQFDAQHARRPRPATIANVLDQLEEGSIWHFACHAEHNSRVPLESALILEDGRLTLRSLFARPSAKHRLAVLSACRTAAIDDALPNEVVSFPSALLQAGIAGVVCSHAEVPDEATMILMLAFFARVRRGIDPPRALADAQRWLCEASHAEISAAFPESYPTPDSGSAKGDRTWSTERPFAEPYAWALFSYSGA